MLGKKGLDGVVESSDLWLPMQIPAKPSLTNARMMINHRFGVIIATNHATLGRLAGKFMVNIKVEEQQVF